MNQRYVHYAGPLHAIRGREGSIISPISPNVVPSYLISLLLTSFHRNWVRCEAMTRLAVAATRQNEVGRAVLSNWSQPRLIESSLHNAPTATQLHENRPVEIRSDEMR